MKKGDVKKAAGKKEREIKAIMDKEPGGGATKRAAEVTAALRLLQATLAFRYAGCCTRSKAVSGRKIVNICG
jgi:hypothetical protein